MSKYDIKRHQELARQGAPFSLAGIAAGHYIRSFRPDRRDGVVCPVGVHIYGEEVIEYVPPPSEPVV